jgi:hypothetical protein
MYRFLYTFAAEKQKILFVLINKEKMRKYFMLLALAVATAASATEMNDTVTFSNPTKVTVMTNDSVQKIKIAGKKDDESFRYETTVAIDKTKTSTKIFKKVAEDGYKWVIDLGIGWSAPTNTPNGHGFAVFRSGEVFAGVRYCYTPRGKTQTYSTGLWCDWRTYGLPHSGKSYINKTKEDIVTFGNYTAEGNDDYSDVNSRINIFSLSVPFLFTQKFGKKSKSSFSIGPVVNFNLRGRINNDYTDGDNDVEISTKGFDYNVVTVDFMGILKSGGIGLYFKYSPMSVLKKKDITVADGTIIENPQFKALSFGLFF